MTLGSLFDGSGGFPLAGTMYGIKPLWCSEIEPYPVAVTKARFPEMLHYTDVSKLNGAELEPVDIITFGSPCQDLSIAGKRAGIKDGERSNLFFEAVRIIKEMRGATNGEYPRYAVWENVPGAFSSNKGEDFYAVLSAFSEIAGWGDSIPQPSGNGRNADKLVWRKAGAILGTDWSLAWRTLDAQYWGVPQRRRRIFIVCDFGGQRAPEILFERKGLSGDSTEGGTAGQKTAGNAPKSVVGGCGDGDNCLTPWDVQSRRIFTDAGTWPALYSGEGGGHGYVWTIDGRNGVGNKELSGTLQAKPNGGFSYNCINPVCVPVALHSAGFKGRAGAKAGSIAYQEEISPTLQAGQDSHVICMATQQGGAEIRTDDKAPTVTASAGMSGNNQPVICIHDKATRYAGKRGDKEDGSGNGLGISNSGVGYTLTVGDRHGVCYPEISGSLVGKTGKLEELVTYQETTGPLMANSHPGSYSGQDAYSDMLVAGDCQRSKRKFIVRRLTPLECCRLQGFPDGWGDLPVITDMSDKEWEFWEQCRADHAAVVGKNFKPKTKEREIKWLNKLHVDGSEYKMWGNGVALPCVAFIMRNIAKEVSG